MKKVVISEDGRKVVFDDTNINVHFFKNDDPKQKVRIVEEYNLDAVRDSDFNHLGSHPEDFDPQSFKEAKKLK